jgi:hypothetical protein
MKSARFNTRSGTRAVAALPSTGCSFAIWQHHVNDDVTNRTGTATR